MDEHNRKFYDGPLTFDCMYYFDDISQVKKWLKTYFNLKFISQGSVITCPIDIWGDHYISVRIHVNFFNIHIRSITNSSYVFTNSATTNLQFCFHKFFFAFFFIVSFIPFFVFGHFWRQSYKNTKTLCNLCLHFARQDGQDGKKTERKSRN